MNSHDFVAFLQFFATHSIGDAGSVASSTGISAEKAAAFAEVFTAFGMLEQQQDRWERVASPEHSGFVFRNMHEIMGIGGQPLLQDFTKRDPRQSWVNVLRILESRRLTVLRAAAEPQRRVQVAQLVLVGTYQNERYVLIDWDTEKWLTAKFLGGKGREISLDKQRPDREHESPLETITREVGEELDARFAETFSIRPSPLFTCSARMISRTRGVLTDYTVFLFAAHGYSPTYKVRIVGEREPYLKWISETELRRGVATVPTLFFRETFSPEMMSYIAECDEPYVLHDEDLERSVTVPEMMEAALLKGHIL